MKRQFFTLVELLLVIVIIAILAGIAVPVVGGMNKKGRETKARAEINAIVTAIKQYEADYGTLPFIPSSNPKMTLHYQKPILPPKQQVGDMTMLMMK